ncbi:uracil phosphoribosyltransferase-domain-containing protein [Chiua virens]|nr:uracil phosphoribosyltransferase-domain-containing protein [Chiua virens]
MSALFDVPGWSVPSAPVSTQCQPKKRKRAAASSEEQDLLRSAQVNLDKLVESLGGSAGPSNDSGDGTSNKRTKSKKSPSRRVNDQPQGGSRPQRRSKNKSKAVPTDAPSTSDKVALPKKKAKKNVEQHVAQPTNAPEPSPAADTPGLTLLQRNLRKSLGGARFRLLNETLYKSSSHEAVKMMKEDPQTFEDYHVGFRSQVQSWPSNPVRHYIRELSSYPAKTVIADLGCGDAALARALLAKKFTVLSFDLVSDGSYVIDADICSRVPLPGSEPQSAVSNEGEAQIVDVVVCALSLMSTNWPTCIREAWRILRPGGELKIAEVASRFSNIPDFISLINSIGFMLTYKDDCNSHFTLFRFKKIARPMISEDEWTRVIALSVDTLGALVIGLRQVTLYILRRLAFAVMPGKRHVLSHPIINARLSQLRLTTTNPKDFREGIHDISFILGVEASRDLEEEPFHGQTPIGPFTGTAIKRRIGLTPILRAGLGMADALLKLFPTAPVYHLGLFREKVSLQPVEYYSKLPSTPAVDAVFLLDPLVATGGTACAALAMLLDWGIPLNKIKLLVVLGSEPGLRNIEENYPDLEIWVAAVDPNLTHDGLISPGLGDTGDRLFNTVLLDDAQTRHNLCVPLTRDPVLHDHGTIVSHTQSTIIFDKSECIPPKFLRMASHSSSSSSYSPSPTLVAPPDDLKSLLSLPAPPSQVASASDLIEFLASCAAVSSFVYVYDLAEQIGFGTLTKSWAASLEHFAPVLPIQTRAGAGLGLVGRLSEGTSQDAINGSILTAYTTPVGLAAMSASLTHLPPASARSRLIIQVPALTPVGDTFTLSPTLASLATSFTIFPDSLAILLSATPQEAVDFALLAYKLTDWHVVHIFDHHSAAREVGHNFVLNHVKDTSDLPI